MNNTNYQLKVRNIIQETKEAITIEFENPGDKSIPYKAGQFFTLMVPMEGKVIKRAYSLCTSPVSDTHPAVTVKRVERGVVSNYLNDHLKIGDTLEVMEPMGVFITEFDASVERHIILLGGGSGITPLMSILKTTLALEPQSVISLIYANRNQDSIIFKEQLEKLQEEHKSRLNVVHILEKAPLFWGKGYKGVMNTKTLKKIFASLPQKDISKTEYFMCGPGGMMKQVKKSFRELGMSTEKLHKESFGMSPEEAATKQSAIEAAVKSSGGSAEGFEVKVIYDGEEYKMMVPPDKTILQVAMENDIDLPYSCQSGMCTACMGRCTSGKVELDEEDSLTPKELEQGYVLTCVGHPVSENVVIEIE